jgi:predicted transposase/invertase (TIGR01784 family)
MNVNKKYKNSLFSFLFSNPDILRELYSAIEGVYLPQDVLIDINTLSDVLVRKQINDISFTIDNRLVVLIEHQSTINDNMPLRLLMYVARIYEKIIDIKKRYQSNLEKIPSPEFIVLYNGVDPYPDYKELWLSEAFKDTEGLEVKKNDDLSLELIVKVYNINYGHNEEILKKCEVLDNYSFFIDNIRENQKKFSLDEAVKSAIKYCIDNNILKDFLEKNSSEVRNMLITEYNRDEEMEAVREEAWEYGLEEGLEKGREEGIITTARNALAKGIPIETVQEITGLDRSVIEELQSHP